MKLLVLVGVFTMVAAPSAFAKDAHAKLATCGADATSVTMSELKHEKAKPTQAPAPRTSRTERPMVHVQTPAPPLPDPNAETALAAQAREDARRRRNGSMEAIPDALLLGGRGAL
ncbi:MAG: hypothetical protein ABUL55_01660 [Pseudomonadota bacterium]